LKENKKMMKFKFEEAIGQSNPEFKKFIGFAIRSLTEVVTCLHKASKRNYIS
jgi:four helix bundle protein